MEESTSEYPSIYYATEAKKLEQDRVVKCQYTRVEGYIKTSKARKPLKREVEAALGLMKLAKDTSGLLELRSQSHGESYNIYQCQDIDIASCNDNSLVDLKKAKNYESFQQNEAGNQIKQDGDRVTIQLSKVGLIDEETRKSKVGTNMFLHQGKYMKEEDEKDNLQMAPEKLSCHQPHIKLRRKGPKILEASSRDGCHEIDKHDEPPFSSLKKLESKNGSLNGLKAFSRRTDIAPETKPLRKINRTIPRSIHTGCSFSIIHFLTAVRTAMVPQQLKGDDALASSQCLERSFKGNLRSTSHSTSKLEKIQLPSLTTHEIVKRVRSNPGDPSVLEAMEPLQDLVTGALKLFSSKEAPLGVKGWKSLTFFSTSSKTWSWRGPALSKPNDAVEEQISPKAWGLSERMVLKLVDSFACWLKNVQEVLHGIENLPEPPVALMMQTINMEERLKLPRQRKIVSTIKQCSNEIRDYFRKEEALRYLLPDRAFSYTALDGRKSMVAPMRRCSGKPSTKGREHFMLNKDRPPHITVLCLVRDAAARLPATVGTRADICTLVRDSQYIVEDISEEQLNQVVSCALDRLHYENDPCVQFNGETRLWVYLHRDREEGAFEDDGTSPTRKRKIV